MSRIIPNLFERILGRKTKQGHIDNKPTIEDTATAVKPGDAYKPRAESLLTGITDGPHPSFEPRYPNASPLLEFLEESYFAHGQRVTKQGIYKPREEGVVDMTLIPGDLPPVLIDTNGQHERDAAFLEHVAEATREGRVLVVGSDVHIGMGLRGCTALTALLAAGAASNKMLVIDSIIPSADNMEEMIKQMEVYEPSRVPNERPWIEMNQSFQRKRKRARAGRKLK